MSREAPSEWGSLLDSLQHSREGEGFGLEALADRLESLGKPDTRSTKHRRDYAARVLLAIRDSVLPCLAYEIGKPAHTALTELMLALHDVDTSGKTGALFKPDPGNARLGRQESAETALRRGWIVLLVAYLRETARAGSDAEAFRQIAADLGVEGVSAGTIKSDFEKQRDGGLLGPVVDGVHNIRTPERAAAAIAALRSLYSRKAS